MHGQSIHVPSTSYELSRTMEARPRSIAWRESRELQPREENDATSPSSTPATRDTLALSILPFIYSPISFPVWGNALPPGLKEPRSIRVMRDSYADPMRHLKSTPNHPFPSPAMENRSLPAQHELREQKRRTVSSRKYSAYLRGERNERLGN